MRVLLVNAASPTYQAYYNKARCTLANGLLYIAATLERAGHEVQIYDGFVDERKPEDFVDFAPAVIGFSVIAGPYLEGSIVQSKRFKEMFENIHSTAKNTALDAQELYYVRVRADVSLGGVNSWVSRMAGDAAETPWVQSSLLTVNRSQ